MANPFDQFDTAAVNPFDQFGPAVKANPFDQFDEGPSVTLDVRPPVGAPVYLGEGGRAFTPDEIEELETRQPPDKPSPITKAIARTPLNITNPVLASAEAVQAFPDFVSDTLTRLGMNKTQANKLGRDVRAGIHSLGPLGFEFTGLAALPSATRTAVKITPSAAKASEPTRKATPLAESISPAPDDVRLVGGLEMRGPDAFFETSELNAIRTDALSRLSKIPGATEPIVKEKLARDVNDAILDLLKEGEVHLAPDIRVSDQVRDLLQTNILEPETFRAILSRHNVSPERFLAQLTQGEIGVAMRESATESARTLQKLSELRKAEMRIRALAGEQSDEVTAFLRSQDNAIDNGAVATMKRVGNVWRGALVSQLATSVRNFQTSIARVGVDVLTEGIERGLHTVFANPVRRMLGKEPIDSPMTALGNFVGLVGPRRAMEITNTIANVKPGVRQDLFSRYASDVNRATGGAGILGKMERAVEAVNFFNRVQDKMLRSSVFSTELRQRLAAKKLDLDKLVAENKIGSIPDDAIKASVEKALEMTWARPLGNDMISETVKAWDRFATLGGRIPNTVTPFTRFMADALRFQYEFSPLGATRLLGKKELQGLVTGEPAQMKVAAKALAGSSFLYAGYLLRTSKHAGPAWYEVNLPDGRTLDARPFAPFAQYLFVADLIKRTQDGTLLGMSSTDLAQGLIGVNFRAGAGLFLVDHLFTQLAGVTTAEKMGNIVKRYAGNVLGGFAVPFQTLKDVIGQFDREERVVRDTNTFPLTGPALSRIPFAGRALPEIELPTRAGGVEREEPLLRQLTGASLRQAPNAAEAELGRLGFRRREILPPTGDVVFDRLMAKHMGPLVEDVIGKVVQAPKYQAIKSNIARAEIIRNVMPSLREQARTSAYGEDQTAKLRLKLRRLPKRQRALIEEIARQRGSEFNLPN